MQTRTTHWPSVFILFIFGISLLFIFAISALLAITSLTELFTPEGDPATSMIVSVAFGFLGVVLLVCGWFVLQKTRSLEIAETPFVMPYNLLWWAVVPGVVLFSLLFGGLISQANLPWLSWVVLPVLTILVIVPPIWLFFSTSAQGMVLGSRWRFFATLGLSMSIAPFIMIILEVVVLGVAILGVLIYFSIAQPALLTEFGAIAQLDTTTMNEEALLALLAPYLTSPLFISALLGYIAVIVPVIEELFKPMALWFFARKLETPAQGFVLGMLSGAAFALFESLNASADGSSTWAMITAARIGTSLLHMFTSGLVGWGIARAMQEKRAWRFFEAFFLAVLIHGIWNASASVAGLSAFGEALGRPEWFFNFMPAALCGLIVLGLGVATLLVVFNRKLRNSNSTQTDVPTP